MKLPVKMTDDGEAPLWHDADGKYISYEEITELLNSSVSSAATPEKCLRCGCSAAEFLRVGCNAIPCPLGAREFKAISSVSHASSNDEDKLLLEAHLNCEARGFGFTPVEHRLIAEIRRLRKELAAASATRRSDG
jgi:hypothetical protein